MYFGFDHLTAAYEKSTVLHDVTLEIDRGEIVTLVGMNGCGKSTLLRTLVGALTPLSGTPVLDGKPIAAYPPRTLAKRIAYLPQTAPLPDLTVRGLVECGRYPYRRFAHGLSAEDNRQIERALALTGLTSLADRPLSKLSGGECQRARIAMAVAQETEILVLDEPITYLDIGHQTEILDLIRRLNRELGVTVLAVLHDLNAAARISDRICALRDGRIRCLGTPEEIFTAPNLRELFGIDAEIAKSADGRPYFIPISKEVSP